MKKIVSLLMVLLLAGCGSTTPTEPVASTEISTSPDILAEINQEISQKFFGINEVDVAKLNSEIARGYVAGLGDPYTVYYDAEETADLNESLSGNLYGTGAQLKKDDKGRVVVELPLEGSPAERAGLMPEDIILAVDGEDISGESIFDVVDLIRGDVGTMVELTVLRPKNDELINFVVERAEIDIDSVTLEWEGDVAVVEINSFDSDTADEFFVIMGKVLGHENLAGIVLDLRYNGGGLVDQAIYMTSLFLPLNAEIVSLQDRNGKTIDNYKSIGVLHDVETPLVVLINEGSASASEIMAGALQDNGRAQMVGEQSYGKGSVQEIAPLSDGGSLKVTIAHWYTPEGKSIQDGGITPDVEVEYTLDDYENGTDPQLAKALEIIRGK